MSVSFCPKNLTEASDEDLDFGPENTLDLDELNAELARLNRLFAAESASPGEPPPQGESG